MALELRGTVIGCQASTNVSAVTWTGTPPVYSSGGINQYAVVVLDTSDTTFEAVTLPAGSAAKAFGVSLSSPVGPGESVEVMTDGIAKCRAASAISKGDTVMVADTNGQIATATAATANFVVGIALEPATAAGQIITVLLDPSMGKVTMP